MQLPSPPTVSPWEHHKLEQVAASSMRALARKHKLWEKEILREGVPNRGKAARHCGHFPSHLQAEEEEKAQG